jgi:iron complex outermembrane receptor protein
MPTFTDLYYSGPTNIGNPELKPEKSTSFEGGLKLNSKLIQGHAVIFQRKGKDIIDWVKSNSEDIWQPQNLTRINSLGAELQVQLNLQKQFGKYFPEKIYFSYFNNNLEKENQKIISNYVLDNLKHKFVMGWKQNISKRILFDLKAVYQDREGTFTGFEDGNWASEVDYSPFWIFDGKIMYQHKNLTAFISATNLLNNNYYDIGNVIQPGRWIKTGISYQIDFN